MKYSVGLSNSRRTGARSVNTREIGKFNTFRKFNARNVKQSRNTKKINPLKLKAKKILYVFIGVLFFLGCIALLVGGLYLKNLQNSLPSPDALVQRSSDQSTQIFDRDGNLLYTVYGDQNREFVSIDKIPEQTKWALLAAEDIEFYQHKGIDYMGIAKAVLQNLKAGGVVRGASTLTQQLVKTTLLHDILGDSAYDQNYLRKVKEVLITMQVEQTFTKDQILQMYMNEVPLGGVNYGFQAAANAYFGKDVSELDLAESALIAGLIQSPGVYSPLYGTNPDLAKTRQKYVLEQMLKHKDLTGVTQDQVDKALVQVLVYSSKKININSPHFVFYVKQILEEKYGIDRVERGGLKVTTTLDSSLQKIAEEEIAKGVDAAKKNNVNNGAMVVLNPNNGQVLAMVGSVDYWNTKDPRVDGNVNVTVSPRQMGSSVKPFVYLTAVNKGYGPWVEAPDLSQIKFGTYDPKNWDSKNMGTMTARKALVYSRNVPAVYMLQLVGIDSFLQTMEKVGVTTLGTKENYGLSLALGSGEEKLIEHTNAFAILANGGIKHDLSSILKVETSSGEILEEVKEQPGQRVFDEKEIYLINWMLCDLPGYNDRPDNGYYVIGGKRVCGKTGTTDGPKDLTTVLYHQNLVVGVWNGNNNGEVAPNAWGTTVPLRIANTFMKRVVDRYPPQAFNRPAGVLATTVCQDTGATPADGVTCEKENSIYISGRAPQVDKRAAVDICTANGLIPDNLVAAKTFGLTSTKILLSTKLENTQQQGAYEQYLLSVKNSTYLLKEPAKGVCTLPLGPDNAPIIDVSKPTNNQSLERGTNLEISGSVRYMESISEFKTKFDGSDISGAFLNANGTFVVNYFIPVGTTLGNHTVTLYAKDNKGKSANIDISIKIVEQGSGINISIGNPSNGSTINIPINIVAIVSGSTPDEVSFYISKSDGYAKTFKDSNSSDGWNFKWEDISGGKGQYQIYATAKKGGSLITSQTISVKY